MCVLYKNKHRIAVTLLISFSFAWTWTLFFVKEELVFYVIWSEDNSIILVSEETVCDLTAV